MSISSMTNLASNRREDVTARRPATARAAGNVELNKAPPADAQSNVGTLLAAITAYIPTEIITVYVATLGALAKPDRAQIADGWVAPLA